MQADPTAKQAKEYVTSLERDAHARGFDLIARKAAKLIPNS